MTQYGAAGRTELHRFLGDAVRFRWLIVVVVLVSTVSVAVFTLEQDAQYDGVSKVLFRETSLDRAVLGTEFFRASENQVAGAEMVTNAALLESRAVARRVQASPQFSSWSLDELLQAVSVQQVGDSSIAEIRARADQSHVAADLADTWAKEFINFRREADRSRINEAIALLKARSGLEGAAERERLAQRITELEVLSAVQTGNAEVVQDAELPTSPSNRRLLRNSALGFTLGLLQALILVLVLSRLDRKVRGTGQAVELSGLPALAELPARVRAKGRVPAIADALDPQAEAFRTLATNVQFLGRGDRQRQVIMVASGDAEDGKTTTVANLAVTFARLGRRVAVIDADLRRPTLFRHFSSPLSPGLSEVLTGRVALPEAVAKVDVSGAEPLAFLPSGAPPPNPQALLQSPGTLDVLSAFREEWDVVLIDSTPILRVADAIPLLPHVDQCLLVVRLNKTTREQLLHTQERIVQAGGQLGGLVVTGVDRHTGMRQGYTSTYEPDELLSGPPVPPQL